MCSKSSYRKASATYLRNDPLQLGYAEADYFGSNWELNIKRVFRVFTSEIMFFLKIASEQIEMTELNSLAEDFFFITIMQNVRKMNFLRSLATSSPGVYPSQCAHPLNFRGRKQFSCVCTDVYLGEPCTNPGVGPRRQRGC